jgi:hypothetical protein
MEVIVPASATSYQCPHFGDETLLEELTADTQLWFALSLMSKECNGGYPVVPGVGEKPCETKGQKGAFAECLMSREGGRRKEISGLGFEYRERAG